MNFLSFSRLLTAACFLCLSATAATAQYSGVTYGSYTSIEYDEETNTVTAYSETVPEDYELAGYYQSQVTLTVTNEFGVTVANGTGQDNGYGTAPVELSFAGEPGRTYTAIGSHRVSISLYSYDSEYPHRLFYWDSWYYTPFESQGVYFPWYYGFYRPVYEPFQRRTRNVNLGRTYDSVSTTLNDDVDFETVTNDANSSIAYFAHVGPTQETTVNLSGANRPVCGTDRTNFNIAVDFRLPPDAISIFHPDVRTKISDTQRQQFQQTGPIILENVNFTTKTARLRVNVRQVRPTAPDNSFRIYIAGGRQGVGSYSGVGRVRFLCP